MSVRELNPVWDGDQGPIIRFEAAGVDASAFDTSTMAISVQIGTEADGLIATVPGILVAAKASGKIDVLLPARPFDADGAGTRFILKPTVYLAVAPGGGPATNLLANSSFDTYTGGTGVADSWVQGGTLGPMVYDVRDNDPAPSSIFGKCQRAYVTTAGSTAYLNQQLSVTINAGDSYSGGLWTRAKLDAGASITNYLSGGGYFIRLNDGVDSTYNYLIQGDRDWTHERITNIATVNHTLMGFQFANYDALGYDIRLDDAMFFKGKWRTVNVPPVRHRSNPRVPAYKGTSLSSGNCWFPFGVFVDSNGDGFPDGWANLAPGVTFALSQNPSDIMVNNPVLPSAFKITLSGATGQKIRFIKRGKIVANKSYSVTVYYKLNAGATGSPAAGVFGPTLSTLPFDGPVQATSTAGANFVVGNTSYAARTRTLVPTNNYNALMCEIALDSVTGVLWIGHVLLGEA